MIVSDSIPCLLFILLRRSANKTANTIMDIFVSETPKTTPIAIPVSAECPSASEKNAIFF